MIGAVALHAAIDALVAGIALRSSTDVMPSPVHARISARSSGRDARMRPITAAKLSWNPGFAACGGSVATIAIAAMATTASPEQRSPARRTAPTPAAMSAARTAETSVWMDAANTAASRMSAMPSRRGLRSRASGTSATAARTPILKPEIATRCWMPVPANASFARLAPGHDTPMMLAPTSARAACDAHAGIDRWR